MIRYTTSLKKYAIPTASIACVIHCLFTPALLVFAPTLTPFVKNIYFEIGILLSSILLGVSIIYRGYCSHKLLHSTCLYFFGIALWIFHSILEHTGKATSEKYLLIGTGFVLLSYFINHRFMKCCPSNCEHER